MLSPPRISHRPSRIVALAASLWWPARDDGTYGRQRLCVIGLALLLEVLRIELGWGG